ncbi:hypothetical protein GCM10027614_70610 [Micromonospora vulcania]
MGIHRLNHAVLYVSDLARSVAFYRDVLGFRPVAMTPDGFRGATFLQAPDSTNDHDLGLFEIGAGAGRSTAGRATVGLYHLAWEVDTLDELAATASGSPPPGRWSAPPTTAPPRASTGRTRTAWSSRSSGWYRPTGSTMPPWRPASGSAGSTWPPSGSATAGRPGAGWGSPSRPDQSYGRTDRCRPTGPPTSSASCWSAS